MKTVTATKTASFVQVTPTMASQWLERNVGNRHLRGAASADLAAAMLRGEWQTTHQGVAFSKSGKLIDGQHRLEAIVKAKVDIELLVVTGLEEEAFSVIDVHIKRTLADTTRLTKRTAEVGRLYSKILLLNQHPTSAQVCEVAKAGMEAMHEKLVAHCGSTRAFYTSAGVRGAAVVLMMAGHDHDKVFKNYSNMALENFSEMNGLSQSLVRMVNAGKVRSNDQRMVFACSLKALNPDNDQLIRLRTTPEDIEAAVSYGRTVLKASLTAV